MRFEDLLLISLFLKMLLHCHSQIQCSSQKPLELSMGMSDDYLQAVSSLLSRSVQMLNQSVDY